MCHGVTPVTPVTPCRWPCGRRLLRAVSEQTLFLVSSAHAALELRLRRERKRSRVRCFGRRLAPLSA
jgi:hypothetical protein